VRHEVLLLLLLLVLLLLLLLGDLLLILRLLHHSCLQVWRHLRWRGHLLRVGAVEVVPVLLQLPLELSQKTVAHALLLLLLLLLLCSCHRCCSCCRRLCILMG
jgi:hypothetical protein